MKVGVRKPSIKRSVKARTTGKIKRNIKKSVNPLYGKSGMGYINDPKKAVYNKVYNKTTIGVSDLLESGKKETYSFQETNYSTTIENYKERATYYKILAVVWAIGFGCMTAFLGIISIFICVIGTILFWNIGKAKANKAKELEREATVESTRYSSNSRFQNNTYTSNTHKEREETDKKTGFKAERTTNSNKQPVQFDTVLVYNGTEKMQWEIKQVHKGDKIEIDIDDDDRYLVSTKDSYDIGYLHKRISNKINDLINDDYEVVDGEIIDITENDGKLEVKVHLVLEDTTNN